MKQEGVPFAIKILRTFCPPQLLEEIEGDLLQGYERDAKRWGKGKARGMMMRNAVLYLRPGIILRNKLSKKAECL